MMIKSNTFPCLWWLTLCLLLSFITAPLANARTTVAMPKAVTVTTFKAKTINWPSPIATVGTLNTYKGTMLTAESNGRVTQIYFKSGQWIKKGQVLVQLYPDIVKAELKKAIANQQLVDKTYQRQLKLAKQGFISQQQLDNDQTNLKSAIASVNQLKAELSLLTVRAPFSGKLGLNQISLGQYLTIGTPIVELQSLDPMRVEFSVAAKYLSQLHLGDQINLQTLTNPQPIHGQIYAINSTIDTNTRMITIRASVPNHDRHLLPGDFATVNILNKSEKVIIVPADAIGYSPKGDYVYRLSNHHTAIKTVVTIGEELRHNRIIIKKGLEPETTIITDVAQLNLKDGSQVTIAKPTPHS